MNILKSRPRFVISVIIAFITFVILHFSFIQILSKLEIFLFCYNAYQWIYVFLLLQLIFNAKPEKIKRLAQSQDENTYFVLVTSLFSSIIALTGIAGELSHAKDAVDILRTIHLVLPAVTLIGVWILLPTLFCIHYAHEYYLAKNDIEKPIRFPDSPSNPDYFDFLYFSVTISVASQTADVAVNNSSCRKLVLAQSILAFIFNTSVIALGINVAASLLN